MLISWYIYSFKDKQDSNPAFGADQAVEQIDISSVVKQMYHKLQVFQWVRSNSISMRYPRLEWKNIENIECLIDKSESFTNEYCSVYIIYQ